MVVDVDLGEWSYPIYIGSGLLDKPELLQRYYKLVGFRYSSCFMWLFGDPNVESAQACNREEGSTVEGSSTCCKDLKTKLSGECHRQSQHSGS
jgi:hypothetical protein